MTDHRLLTAEREQKILQSLRRSRVLSVARLSDDLSVSEATIRRDLHGMQERGLLQRIHGGATLHALTREEPMFADKEGLHAEAKRRIAEAALDFISDRDTVYLDGGSTVLALARTLDVRRDLTVVTNSLMAAGALMNTQHRLILVGGEFRALSRTLVGPLTSHIIDSLNLDKAFMGTIGLTVPDGMTTTDPGEAFTKEQILRRANQVFLLADSSKLGVPSFARSGSLEDIDVLITEDIDTDLQHDLEGYGVRVVVARSQVANA